MKNISVSNTPFAAVPADRRRKAVMIQAPSGTDLFVSFEGDKNISPTKGLRIPAGSFYKYEVHGVGAPNSVFVVADLAEGETVNATIEETIK